MSVGIELLPIAIALNIAFATATLSSWQQCMQLKFPTRFTNERELIKALRMAGYDAERVGGTIKTHFSSEHGICSWERIGGRWTAIFSRGASKDLVREFMRDLTEKLGADLFIRDGQTGKVQPIPNRTFPTNFRDGDLLFETLRAAGAKPVRASAGDIECRVGQATMRFSPVEDSAYVLQIENALNQEEIFEELCALDGSYKRAVQQSTCERLKERAVSSGMVIESEEVLEDQSIVITLTVSD